MGKAALGSDGPRVVFVTGAASGIGAATAVAFAEEGDTLVLFDRDEDAVEATADALRASGARAEAVAGDVTSAASCAAAFDLVSSEFGRLDVLVNNAGIGAFDATLETTDEELWDAVLDVNLKSVFLVSRGALPLLRSAGGGCIVNVASVHAIATAPGVLPYAAAKGGALALTREMALELAADAIRVVAVLPGAVDTPMLASQAERSGRTLGELGFSDDPTAIGRIGTPNEVAAAIVFLASPQASFVTGAALAVDGGLLARL